MDFLHDGKLLNHMLSVTFFFCLFSFEIQVEKKQTIIVRD